jgi:hypothetical protein
VLRHSLLRRLACALAAAWSLTVAGLILFADTTPASTGLQPASPPADPHAGLDITGPSTSASGSGISNLKSEISNSAPPPPSLIDQTHAEAARKSAGCIECHAGIEDMHASPHVVLGCIDCHGGDPTPGLTMRKAHVAPRHPELWPSSANPADASVLLNHESPEFIRFINPGDLRVSDLACGACHGEINTQVGHSMMRHGAMLWGAALYNNGATPQKNPRYGQAYGADGAPLRLDSPIPVTDAMTRIHAILPFIEPLPRFALGQPSNILRIFERGGEKQIELGNPNAFEPPGRPARRLSERGLGTNNRTDPVYLNLQKTRLHDPMLDFMGSNDHPGDYRSSGCTACHVPYANDRSPTNSGPWAKYGHQGLSFSADPMISKKEKGHPIKHQFTRSIPSSQCMNCHMHQGNLFVNPFLGYIWWDQESDGEFMYPKEQKDPTAAEERASLQRNPEAAAARGLWGDSAFLERVAELNPQLKETQFADYHGHGWVFRAVFKKDKEGNLLTLDDKVIPASDSDKFKKAVHLKDVHLARGMQCVDCHFTSDVHGNGLLYAEPRAATAIECIDCHGTIDKRPTLRTSGAGGRLENGQVLPNDLAAGTTPFGPRFRWVGKRLYQQSMMDKNLVWEVPQTLDVIDPSSAQYNPKAAHAKTLRRDGTTWGSLPTSSESQVSNPKSEIPPALPTGSPRDASGTLKISNHKSQISNSDAADAAHASLAHGDANISCQVCHTSWATSCFGCHLPLKANQKVPGNKFEGTTTRFYTSYNPQVVRDDVFMLGKDATYKNNRLAVIRSSSAVIVGSQNANREWVYSQQQTISSEGYSGQAFNPHFAHTTSSVGTTKGCTDCHLSEQNDNHAWMTQLLGFGTGTVNFFGRHAYVANGSHGLDAVIWTEREEPQAALGSHLQRLAYPRNHAEHVAKNSVLTEAHHHHGAGEVLDVLQRGEYLYAACGEAGFVIFDIANVDNKGFSERIVTAPVSPLGQRLYVKTKYATSVTSPSTLALDPLRIRLPENEEQPIGLNYGFLYITDREEGLVMVLAATLLDGDPANNFFDEKKDVVRFNPDGVLSGATHAYMAGTHLYVVCSAGLAVVDVADPFHPKLLVAPTPGVLRDPRKLAVQFQHAFVTDADGVKVFALSELSAVAGSSISNFKSEILNASAPSASSSSTSPLTVSPSAPRLIATLPLSHAEGLYAARTYLYVADGSNGLAIIDIKNPATPRLHSHFTADGALNDTRAIQIGAINASMFGLVADGKNGLRVVQLISPENQPNYMGFSPEPRPKLIATYPTAGPALAVSRGLDRDRVVDETGGQTVVFGRRGSRPLHAPEWLKFLQHADGTPYRVEDVITQPDGTLRTTSGAALTPATFVSPEPNEVSEPKPRSRLERRPVKSENP